MRLSRRLTRFLSDYRWYLLAIAIAAVFALGSVGWFEFLAEEYPHKHVDFSDAAYISIKDFFIDAPDKAQVPVEADVARFVAPLVAGWATISALGVLFRDRLQQLRARRMRDHVVVCGLGDYVGSVFLRDLHENRVRAVVIEVDATNPDIEACRTLGIPVIVGDAQRRRTLQAAGAQHASRVLAITPKDSVNTQIVATVRSLPRRHSTEQRCLALITDPEFCRLLRIQETQRDDPELSVDFFNINEISARLLLEDHPLDIEHGQPHILVAHLDPLGEWLIYHAARAWYDARADSRQPLVVTVLDEQPKVRIDALLGQHPALENYCEFFPFTPTNRDIGRLPEHHSDPRTPEISRAFVTAYRDEQAFETALRLRHELDPAIPVVAVLSRRHGVAGLLGEVKDAGALSSIDVFSSIDRTATAEFVRVGSVEPMAHAIHELWRKDQIRVNKPAPTWDDLDEARRESSRDQARHIPVKLRLVGCAIAPLRDWDAKEFTFEPDELDMLGVAEHERWNNDRIAGGWTLIDMPQADDPEQVKLLLEEARRRKETPYLLPWDELLRLYPDIAEYDRMFVRRIPTILASVGLQVIRTPTAAKPATSHRVLQPPRR